MPDGHEVLELEPGTAHVAWELPITCGFTATRGCETALRSPFDATPEWFVTAEGAIVEARAVYSDRCAVQLRKISPGGEVLWSVGNNIEPSPPECVVALAAEGNDGAALIVVGSYSGDRQKVYTVDAKGNSGEMFELQDVGAPVQVAAMAGGIALLSYYDLTLELARYDRQGELIWRQTRLLPIGVTDSDLNLALVAPAPHGAIRVLQSYGSEPYQSGVVEADGERSQLRFLGDGGYVDGLGALFNDAQDRPVAAYENYEHVYQVVRCEQPSCEDSEDAKAVEGRPAESFYPARMLGAAADPDSNVFVVTEAGPRSDRQLLLDRISSDFEQRRAFVVSGLDVREVTPKALAIGPHGEIYYWTERAIGRIELGP